MTELEINRSLPQKTLLLYLVLFLVDLIVTGIALSEGHAPLLVITIPVGVIVALTIFTDRKTVHIPPVLVLVLLVTMIVAVVPTQYEENDITIIVSDLMVGISFMFIGMILSYLILEMDEEKYEEHHLLLYALSFCMAMTILVLMLMLRLWMYDGDTVSTELIIVEGGRVILGTVIATILCELGLSKYIINSKFNKSLSEKNKAYYTNDEMLAFARKTIAEGESDRVEFKSTLVTNLVTGEADKRMEKAVLKTINAFLNTRGGMLLIGVADDGSIPGVDEKAFDSRDKMGLHLTHLISARMGDEYFAYVWFRIIDVEEGKSIILVNCDKCKKPVFLLEGKEEQFYVRSGPSSVELKGHDLVNYIRNRSDKKRKRILSDLVVEDE